MISNNIQEVMPIFTETLYQNVHEELSGQVLEGGFEKKVLVVIQQGLMENTTLEFLHKMLAACKLELSDYYLVAIPNNKFHFSLMSQYQPETVLLFGVALENESFNILKKPHTPFRFHQQKWLLAETLPELIQNPGLKTSLWVNGLKPLFAIS